MAAPGIREIRDAPAGKVPGDAGIFPGNVGADVGGLGQRPGVFHDGNGVVPVIIVVLHFVHEQHPEELLVRGLTVCVGVGVIFTAQLHIPEFFVQGR